ncbi:MAG: hypothetical protein BEU04_02390 [Marine Group III euryarchaeote CG-Bathy1]|uniref:DUF373 family protein n=1 Tax=Marine Group III euryarchaeote CG-Bathy1 TaxID=1889001 RepID=A0A1J5TT39_9ARCH|nr:MAG: hypothetical protein BEU04_02390 [Marine Group III euryarchaeote CG-Bathy1]
MKTLVIALDRDDDVGRKTGLKSPIIGRENNIEAAVKLGLADPEDSDTNAIFEAIKTYDRMLSDKMEVEVVTICGDTRVGTRSDIKIANTLDKVIELTGATRAILVTDGAEDNEVIPIIRSRLKIDSTRVVVVKQAKQIEDAVYLVLNKIQDPKIQRKVVLPIGLAMFVWGALHLVGKADIAEGTALVILGGYLLIKVAGWEQAVRTLYNDALTGGRARFSLYTYLTGIVLIIYGITKGYRGVYNSMKTYYGEEPGLKYQDMSIEQMIEHGLIFISSGNGLWESFLFPFIFAILMVETGRTIDKFLSTGEFNINFIRFAFTIFSLGLMAAGAIQIVKEMLGFRNDDPTFWGAEGEVKGILYILLGVVFSFVGLILHDYLREKFEYLEENEQETE